MKTIREKIWEDFEDCSHSPKNFIESLIEILDMNEQLFCDPQGQSSFAGSDGDRDVFDRVLKRVRERHGLNTRNVQGNLKETK